MQKEEVISDSAHFICCEISFVAIDFGVQ